MSKNLISKMILSLADPNGNSELSQKYLKEALLNISKSLIHEDHEVKMSWNEMIGKVKTYFNSADVDTKGWIKHTLGIKNDATFNDELMKIKNTILLDRVIHKFEGKIEENFVIINRDGKQVGSASTKKRARGIVDKKDNELGSYVHKIHYKDPKTNELHNHIYYDENGKKIEESLDETYGANRGIRRVATTPNIDLNNRLRTKLRSVPEVKLKSVCDKFMLNWNSSMDRYDLVDVIMYGLNQKILNWNQLKQYLATFNVEEPVTEGKKIKLPNLFKKYKYTQREKRRIKNVGRSAQSAGYYGILPVLGGYYHDLDNDSESSDSGDSGGGDGGGGGE